MTKEFATAVKALGWSVEEEEEGMYRLGKYSPYGQDFSILVEGETVQELVEAVYDVYENFDVSEETYLWLDHTGHGKNGAPHEMKDVLADMEACEANILSLHSQLVQLDL